MSQYIGIRPYIVTAYSTSQADINAISSKNDVDKTVQGRKMRNRTNTYRYIY